MAKPLIIGATATTLAAGLGAYVWQQEHRAPLLEVYVIALKNGQATFIRTPDDTRILIDGGSNSEIIRHISTLLPFYSRRIDVIVATDTSVKGVSGLIDIIGRYTVERAYIQNVTSESAGLASSTDPVFKTFLETLKNKKISLTQVGEGDRLDMGKEVGGRALFPAAAELFAYSKASGPQMVVDMTYKDTSVLLLGDATKKIQKYIASENAKENPDAPLGDRANRRAMLLSGAAASADMSSELIDQYKPDIFVYSKKISYSPPKAPVVDKKVNKKSQADPLGSISQEQRYNVRETGVIKIVSDGISISVTSP